MAVITTLPNYVKFQRGTPAAYNNLVSSGRVDSDCLYFISEKTATEGKLYAGTKLVSGIGGGGSGSGSSITYLSELEDVILSNIKNDQLLVYDKASLRWKNISISSLITEYWDDIWKDNFDENVFEANDQGETSLRGFSAAPVGSLLIKNNAGHAAWSGVIPTQIQNLQTTKLDRGEVFSKQEVIDLVANHSHRKIVESIEAIDPEDPNAEKYVYLIRNDNDQGELYDEYIVVDGEIVQTTNDSFDTDDYVTKNFLSSTLISYAPVSSLNNYVTKEQYTTEFGDFQELILDEEGYTMVDQVNSIRKRLTWSDAID